MKSCNKKRFDKIKDMLVIADDLNSTELKRQEKRFYWCNVCKSYHVTKS